MNNKITKLSQIKDVVKNETMNIKDNEIKRLKLINIMSKISIVFITMFALFIGFTAIIYFLSELLINSSAESFQNSNTINGILVTEGQKASYWIAAKFFIVVLAFGYILNILSSLLMILTSKKNKEQTNKDQKTYGIINIFTILPIPSLIFTNKELKSLENK